MPAHRRPPTVRAPRVLRLAVLGLLLAVLAPLLAAGPTAPASAALVMPPGVEQLITVRTSTPSATSGYLRAYDLVNGSWKLRYGPVFAYVGAQGIGKASEYVSRTPEGNHPLTGAFGRLPDPGTAMPYFRTDVRDWWDSNPSSRTYNTHVRRTSSPGGNSENLYRTGWVYDHAIVVGYNTARTPGAGSAIFLHLRNGKPTGGCASVDRASMVWLLRWLDPAKKPYVRFGVY
jgi:L,D-peptidoglycan transpeptidase YkuD (ErfK/YbiS/YcfS/YnhG family)